MQSSRSWIRAGVLTAAVLSLFAVPVSASPSPATLTEAPLQVKRSVTLATSAEEVYQVFADPDKILELFPGLLHDITVDNSQARVPNGVGSVRTCNLADGSKIQEKVKVADTGKVYAYSVFVNPFGLQNHLGYVEIETMADGRVHLSWSQYFDHPDAASARGMVGMQLDTAMKTLDTRYNGKSKSMQGAMN